ncbi:MAG TPA: hypothetical protein VF487_00355 [Chitinophagaceae bacterium]
MYLRFVLIVLLAMQACSKENDIQEKSAAQLLTQQEWILSGYGYDHNTNGVIDVSEESIEDCEKDNTCRFETDGTGKQFDNTLTCGNGLAEQPFTWKLINNESELDFSFGIARILRLDEDKLIITDNSGGQAIKFITVFRH